MSKLISLDAGHGQETAGKRTPLFANGTFMHEHEFNQAVVNFMIPALKRCGFRVLDVAPEANDVPLETRVARANQANADLYLSVHANALRGVWGQGGQGVETLYFPNSSTGKKLAEILQKHLLKGTKQVDRKIKERGDLYVLKHTKMVASLVECAFMDDEREAKLLLSDAFRKECAEELTAGICEYFNVPYVSEQPPQPQKPVEPKSSPLAQWQLDTISWVKENKVSDGTRPLENITRVEVMAMIKNYHENKGK